MGGGRSPTLWRIVLLTLAFLCAGREAFAQQNLEDAVKATFLFRFASFAAWPDSAFADTAAPVVICVAGDSAFERLVEQSAANQRVAGRPVSVRGIGAAAIPDGCHILYLALPAGGAHEALDLAAGHPVLTVTDSRFGSIRGAIHFTLNGGHVRFHIDRRSAERNGISLNARLLNIAALRRRRAR